MTTMPETTLSSPEGAAVPSLSYYAALGVQSSVDQVALRKRYRALALENHPDRFDSPEQKAMASGKFKAIREAYEVLADTEQRRRYDASLAQGRPFVAAKRAGDTSESSLADIFSDVDRFQFPTNARQITDERVRELINKSIISSDTLKEKVISVHGVVKSDICQSTVAVIRGAAATATNLVLTNFRIIIGISGSSSYQSGNTRYSQTYWAGTTVMLSNLSRIDLTVSGGRSTTFDVALYGPETPLAGTRCTLSGSPTALLWLANLYAIPVVVTLDVRTNHRAYQRSAKASLALGVAALGALVGMTGSSFWANAWLQSMLLAAPLALLTYAAVVQNLKSSALARLYSLLRV
jgi:DnaJ-domain-containing protein 1